MVNIDIPDGVTSIGDYAFSSCSSVASMEIPNRMASILHGVFPKCSNLAIIESPNSVASIGYDAFRYCSSLESITVNHEKLKYKTENGVLFSNDMKTVIKYPPKKNLNSYEIPINVELVTSNAFESCLLLATIINVTQIREGALRSCTNLTTVYFHGLEESSYKAPFINCSQLHQIIIPNNNYTATTFCGFPIAHPSPAKPGSKPLQEL